MKFFNSTCLFDHKWEDVTCANWKKYPNEITTHVEAVDILRREIVAGTSILRTERLITVRQPVPGWVSALIGGCSVSHVREVSDVDPVAKTLVLRSQNLTMAKVLLVNETVTYRPDPSNPEKTLFKQDVTFQSPLGWRRLCNKIEEWSLDRFQQNADLGKMAFESVLSRLSSSPARA